MTDISENSSFAHNSKKSSAQQLSFLAVLHYDIVVQITSYLTQAQCLICMEVCRDWYSALPQYTQSAWRTLNLRGREASKNHLRRDRCLGSHVRRVAIMDVYDDRKQKALTTLMERLVEWKCTQLESLELQKCAHKDQQTLFCSLKQFGSCLTHLKLEDYSPSIQLGSILDSCLELTHLTYIYSCPLNTKIAKQLMQPFQITSSTHYTKITHLVLHVDIVTEKQLEGVLKRCPELKCYIGVTMAYEAPYIINLDSLFSWCPKVSYVVNSVRHSPHLFGNCSDIRSHTGLYHLNIAEDRKGIDHLARCLQRNQETLENLEISNYVYHPDWTAPFGSLCLPNLRFLLLHNISCSTPTIIAMINQCPLLENLIIVCLPNISFESSDIQLLSVMHHLIYFSLDCSTNDGQLCLSTMLERFPALETLTLWGQRLTCQRPDFECPKQLKEISLLYIEWMSTDIPTSERREVFAQFLKRLAHYANLESITLTNVDLDLGFEVLSAITMAPALQRLEVPCDYYLSDRELESFFQLLDNTEIQQLYLHNIDTLHLEAVQELSKLQLLDQLQVTSDGEAGKNPTITKEGLKYLLNTSPQLQDIEFSYVQVKDEIDLVLTGDEVTTFIQEQVSNRTDWRSTSGYWKVTSCGETEDEDGSTILTNLAIEWDY